MCDRTGLAQAERCFHTGDILNSAGFLEPLRIASLVRLWAGVACGGSRIDDWSSQRVGKGESSGAFTAHSHAID